MSDRCQLCMNERELKEGGTQYLLVAVSARPLENVLQSREVNSLIRQNTLLEESEQKRRIRGS